MHIWLLQRITLYQRTYEITSLNKTEFLETYVRINNPHWQSSGTIISLCKYYIVISDRLVGSFLDALFVLLAVILSELPVKPRRKDWVAEKSTLKNLYLLTAYFLFYVIFYCFFCLLPPPSRVTYLLKGPYIDR